MIDVGFPFLFSLEVLGQVGNGVTPDVDIKALKAAFQATQRLLRGALITAGPAASACPAAGGAESMPLLENA